MKYILFFLLMSTFLKAFAGSFYNQRLEDKISGLPQSDLKNQLQGISKVCSDVTNLSQLLVPKDRKFGNELFSYFYEYQLVDPNLPTIVFFPGGPGGWSIGSQLSIKGANLIKIDPRGVGCNFGDEKYFTPDQVSTENVVDDVLDLIKKENLKRVILYGQSYGTVVATVLAAKMEQQGMLPELTILDGTLGRGWDDWGLYLQEFSKIGNYFLEQNPDLRQMFLEPKLPLDLPSDFWAYWLAFLSGNRWDSMMSDLKILGDMSAPDYESVKQDFLYNFKLFNDHQTDDRRQLPHFFVYQSVLCSELSKNVKSGMNFKLIQGDLILDQSSANNVVEYCPNEAIYRPYDSHNFQISSPIVYFQGETDPQTPIAGALYHREGQPHQENKYFYTTVHGGHSPLDSILMPCSDKIWAKLLSKDYGMSEVLDETGHCLDFDQ